MKQNITLSLEKELIKKAKVLAPKKDISVTKLLAEQLAKIFSEEGQYEVSKRRALARLKKGFHLGGSILAKREEIHERR